MDYRTEIRTFIGANISLDNDDVTLSDDDNYFELRFVNSLFAMKLVDFVEQKFDLTIENDELDLKNFSTVNNLVALIDNKLASKGAIS
ncbi:phosphopantetheine-binding protein [Paenibacillus sp. SC116]|uniref:acyl carrier protein n=1 Tax=Paenibacillus sp. SC116 TaxID=2968986 RepID=UPI00215A813A|nr:phosphopantetheine-binding protein [Paenibacillus sp. SC116]MCR8844305.1 phosphopantetheine-binding protein [Paenibacillus sp. SC116]